MKLLSYLGRLLCVLGILLFGFAAYFVVLLFSGKGGMAGIFALIGLFVNAIVLAFIAIIAGFALRLISRRHGRKKLG